MRNGGRRAEARTDEKDRATNLALGHGARDGKRITVDASDESVAVLALALTAVVALEDDSLAASEAAVGDNDDLALLQARCGQGAGMDEVEARERTI